MTAQTAQASRNNALPAAYRLAEYVITSYSIHYTKLYDERTETLLRVEAVIWVEKTSQKGIIIGRGGERLKLIGTRARKEMEKLFGSKVHLELWVKVREDWADSESLLRSLQYGDI